MNSGERLSSSVPICEGYVLPHAVQLLNVGGCDLAEYLRKMLETRGIAAWTTQSQCQTVRELAEKEWYIALDFDAEFEKAKGNSANERSFVLHAENSFTICSERFCCPEILFKPSFIGKESSGLPEMISRSIMKCDVDTRKDLYANVVLSGGTSMIPGMRERLQKELMLLAPSSKIIVQDPDPYSAWIGGSRLTSTCKFQEWIFLDEYNEKGPEIVHAKCF